MNGRFLALASASLVAILMPPASAMAPIGLVRAVVLVAPMADEGAPDLRERANLAFGAGRFAEAALCYQRLTVQDPDDAQAWYRLGMSLHSLKKYEDAAAAHHRAAQFSAQRAPALYNLACAEAMLGKGDESFKALGQATEAGFAQVALMESDMDLASVRNDPRFAAIVAKARENAADSPSRRFDFWVGIWDVYNPDGKLVGHSVVKKLHEGHVIEENWWSEGGTTGMSLNYWDPERNAWRQTWVDQFGQVVEYEGAFEDGAMRLEGWRIKPDGTRVMQRVAFTPNEDGTVRQFIEESSDGGTTWATYFDGMYVKRVLPVEKEPE